MKLISVTPIGVGWLSVAIGYSFRVCGPSFFRARGMAVCLSHSGIVRVSSLLLKIAPFPLAQADCRQAGLARVLREFNSKLFYFVTKFFLGEHH